MSSPTSLRGVARQRGTLVEVRVSKTTSKRCRDRPCHSRRVGHLAVLFAVGASEEGWGRGVCARGRGVVGHVLVEQCVCGGRGVGGVG